MQFDRISLIFYGLSFLVISYFIFHIYHGDRGLYARDTLSVKIASLEKELAEITEKREKLEWKINHLGSGRGTVDPDLLLEHMRDLGYVRSDEILLVE